METLVQPLVAQLALSQRILSTGVKDLSDADARMRSRGGTGPSVAWNVGHLCHHKIGMLKLLGHERENPFAAQFATTAATDGSDYPTLASLISSYTELNDALSAAVAEGAALLDSPMPGSAPHAEKKIFDTILFFTWHEAYHIGAMSAIRRDLGRKSIPELVSGK
jgi:uncharacterized damage-inducible protein DinB